MDRLRSARRSLERMPANTASPRPLRRAITAAAAALLLAAGGLLVASPASAHDELVSSDPAADTSLEALPAELTLTFSGELATDPGATELQITDASGALLADGDPVVEGTVVTQPLSGAASGLVTVLWKVVSSDGHPISGDFGFTVTAPPTPTPTATSAPSEDPTAAPTEEPTAEPTEAPVPADSSNPALPWIIGGLLLLAAIGGAVAYLLISRAHRIRDEEALRASAAEAAAGGPVDGSGPRSEPPVDR